MEQEKNEIRNRIKDTLEAPVPESDDRTDMQKFIERNKSVPCRYFHHKMGCPHGTSCFFKHDYRYDGVPIPNMEVLCRPVDRMSKWAG